MPKRGCPLGVDLEKGGGEVGTGRLCVRGEGASSHLGERSEHPEAGTEMWPPAGSIPGWAGRV